MKRIQWIFVFVLLYIIQSCNCEFASYRCSCIDNSTVKIEDESYQITEQDYYPTHITENDSLIFIDYAISSTGVISSSKDGIGNGFMISLAIKKVSDSHLILKSGSVEFIKNYIGGDIYGFESHQLSLGEYVSCKCQKEVGVPVYAPEKLKLTVDGVISNGTERKTIEVDLQFETKKIEVRNC